MENQTVTQEQTGNIVWGYCDGCSKINASFECTVYLNPKGRCRIGCAFSPQSLANLKLKANQEKKRVGQQKQKKKDKK
jgi:hypothetical protein